MTNLDSGAAAPGRWSFPNPISHGSNDTLPPGIEISAVTDWMGNKNEGTWDRGEREREWEGGKVANRDKHTHPHIPHQREREGGRGKTLIHGKGPNAAARGRPWWEGGQAAWEPPQAGRDSVYALQVLYPPSWCRHTRTETCTLTLTHTHTHTHTHTNFPLPPSLLAPATGMDKGRRGGGMECGGGFSLV